MREQLCKMLLFWLACLLTFCQESREDSLEKYLHHHCTPQVFLGCLLVTLLDDLPLSTTKSCQISWTLNFWRPNGYWCSFRQGVVIFQECLPLSWMICSATQHDPIFHPDFDRLAAVQSAKIAIKHFYNMLIEFDFCPLKRLKVLQKILIVPRLKMFHWR